MFNVLLCGALSSKRVCVKTNANKLFAHVQMAKLMQIVQTMVTKNVHRVTLAFA